MVTVSNLPLRGRKGQGQWGCLENRPENKKGVNQRINKLATTISQISCVCERFPVRGLQGKNTYVCNSECEYKVSTGKLQVTYAQYTYTRILTKEKNSGLLLTITLKIENSLKIVLN